MKVVLIGSGNVATILGRKIKNAGHEILQVAGRNNEEVSKLASLLQAGVAANIHTVSTLADIYIIAVPDKAIREIADGLE